MKNNNSTNVHNKPPLKFIIEGKEFETTDQFKTGAELKVLGGIPLETELFLSIEKPYYDELIENDKDVNLARPGLEYFFVKKKLHFKIDSQPFVWYKQFIRGIQLKELAKIAPEALLFLDIEEGWEDDLIENDEVVDLARPGVEHFITEGKPVKLQLIVNATPHEWNQKSISFEQVVVLAFGNFDPNPEKGYTVTFSRGPESKPEGTMVKGSVVSVKNKMIFDVTATDKS